MKVEYNSKNSGGHWWLTDGDWKALEAAGWEVDWRANHTDGIGRCDSDGRWLGALANKADRYGLSLRDAAAEWERITGKSATEAGFPCCGQPHTFTEYDDDGNWVEFGPNADYHCEW